MIDTATLKYTGGLVLSLVKKAHHLYTEKSLIVLLKWIFHESYEIEADDGPIRLVQELKKLFGCKKVVFEIKESKKSLIYTWVKCRGG